MNKLEDIENNLTEISSLIEILKGYCDNKCEYSKELSTIIVILDIITSKQNELTKIFENLLMETKFV